MKKTAIIDILNNLEEDGIVAIHNEYCDACNAPDNCVYGMDEFNDILAGFDPMRIANMVCFGNFNPNADWFYFNGYGNIACFHRALHDGDSPIYVDDIADYIIDHDEDFGISDIRDILDTVKEG